MRARTRSACGEKKDLAQRRWHVRPRGGGEAAPRRAGLSWGAFGVATGPAFSVRHAGAADLETVSRLRFALLREQSPNPLYHRVHPDAERRGRRLFATQLASANEVMLLAESDAGAIGILRCCEVEGSPLLLPERYGYISSAYVLPEWRRRGVLRALVHAAEEWARDRELAELRLTTASDSLEALAAWDALGFAEAEQLRIRRLPPRD